MVFDDALEHYGIEYQIGDALEIMGRSEHLGQYDVMRMTGLLSYYPKTEEKEMFIRRALGVLVDDGVIVCDLQTMGSDMAKSSLVRSALINLWPMDPDDPHKLTPSASPEAAILEMGDICRGLGLKMVWRTDFCNGNTQCTSQAAASPKCVAFLIGKHISENMFDDVPELGVM